LPSNSHFEKIRLELRIICITQGKRSESRIRRIALISRILVTFIGQKYLQSLRGTRSNQVHEVWRIPANCLQQRFAIAGGISHNPTLSRILLGFAIAQPNLHFLNRQVLESDSTPVLAKRRSKLARTFSRYFTNRIYQTHTTKIPPRWSILYWTEFRYLLENDVHSRMRCRISKMVLCA
jgi:hypothetical protein